MEMSTLYSILFNQEQGASYTQKDLNEKAYEFFLNAMKISSIGIWCWNLLTGEVLLSSEVFKITGADTEKYDGTMKYIVDNIIHPAFKTKFEEAVKYDLERKQLQVRDYRVNNQNQMDCWIRLHGQIVIEDENKMIRVIGTLIDVTNDYVRYNQAIKELSFMEAMFEASPNPIFYKDRSGLYRYCNTAFLEFLGLTKEQVIGKSVYEIASYPLACVYDAADEELFSTLSKQVYESQIKKSNGLHDVIFNKAVYFDNQNKPAGLVGIIQDITEKKKSEQHLKMLHKVKDAFLDINHVILGIESENELLKSVLEKLQGIFEASGQACIFKVCEDGMVRIVSSYGYDEAEASKFKIGMEESFWWGKLDNNALKALIIEDIQGMAENSSAKIVDTISSLTIKSSLVVPIVIDTQLKWILSIDSSQERVFTDVHERVAEFIGQEIPLLYRIFELNQQNLYLSRHDALTGVMTRSYLDIVFEDLKAVCNRNNLYFCVVIFDLDGLKIVNDNCGHYQGDLYLKSLADLLLSSFRESDKFFRIGGDEFLGLFFNTTRLELQPCIEKLRSKFEETELVIKENKFKFRFSYGIASYPEDSEDKQMLIKLADKGMYNDKEQNKQK
jgi:diguanylate cyclase (GGDEF)-like protein/PAS domain S-box-containing protein